MRKSIVLFFSVFFSSLSFSQEAVYPSVLDKVGLIRFCGEVVVDSYDSVSVDGAWMLDRLNARRLDIPTSDITPKFHRYLFTAACKQAYWPKAGDTCLLVLDQVNGASVALFGILKDNGYLIWDPYSRTTPVFTTIKKEELRRLFEALVRAGRAGC